MSQERSARRPTIVDVAAHAGVSTAAVSKVLRNAYGVSPAMQARVRASIDALGYRPHAAARGMRGRTYTVGVLLDSIRNPFFADLLEGIEHELAATEYRVLVGAAGYGAGEQRARAEAMVDRRMDGLIVIGPGWHRDDVVATATSTPTVVVGHHDPADHYDAVVHDEASGARLAVEHLASLGHRRIGLAVTAGVPGTGWARRPEVVLEEGYRSAMTALGLDERARVERTTSHEPGGHEAGLRLLDGPDRVTAVLCGTDLAAVGVLRAANDLGLRVPDDMSVVGYNNTSLADLVRVRLTSVDQAGHQMGSAAAHLLLERIEGRTRDTVVTTTPRLVPRDTTGTAPASAVGSRGVAS